jgi:hypothetical protein
MPDYGFNGTTVTGLGSGSLILRSVNYEEGGADVDVSGAADDQKTYEPGLPDISVSIEVVGATTVGKGDTANVSVTWTDGTTDTLAAGKVSTVSKSGSMDSEILSTVVVKPARA